MTKRPQSLLIFHELPVASNISAFRLKTEKRKVMTKPFIVTSAQKKVDLTKKNQ